MPMPSSESPVLVRAAAIADAAKELYVNQGMDPSTAIVKLESEMGGPNDDPMTDLIVAKTNHAIWSKLFHEQADKRVEFPIAKAETIKSLRGATMSEPKIASCWRTPLLYEQGLEKRATDKRGRQLTSFGVPMVVDKNNLGKVAAEREVLEAVTKSNLAASLTAGDDLKKRAEFLGAIEEFKDRIKTAADEGKDVFTFAYAITHACDSEIRKEASVLADHCVESLMSEGRLKPDQYGRYATLAKTASVDMDDEGFAVIRGGDHLVIRLNTCINNMKGGYSADGGRLRPEQAGRKDNGGMVATDDTPYEVEGIYRPRQSRPNIFRTGVFK